ncbi:hypothetical protein [Chryseobacterium indoltheticum]|uniref:Uncharacterized protein n=1 Tax=Chryseobacterium indoltheticum TaxID=254 RepID=A0A381FIJ6_9FLAO|nr:hypothetical protein [Chryseobacterium indoltheticum]SUX46347.1 Uncharacterised protein [Chryseobacterium indoltheticum]
MNTTEKIDYFRNIVEIQLEDIALSLKTNQNDTNTFILKFNNSVYELFNSTFLLLNGKYLESGGTILSSLWERNLTLEYIYLDFEIRKSAYQNHSKLKKSPWKIFQMVKEITDFQNHPTLSDNLKFDLYYIQYTILCAIKHGNPHTFSYLNREENHSVIGLKIFDESVDEDLITFLKIQALTIVIEFISNYYSFSKNDKKTKFINLIDIDFKNFVKVLDLNVPRIINADENEYEEETWNYFDNL